MIAASIVVFLAAGVHACTGFGFSILAAPYLLLIFDPAEAIQINIALSIGISLLLAPKLASDVDKPLLGRLVFGGLAGAPFGIALYLLADPEHLRAVVGALLLGFTALILRDFKIARSRRKDVLIGGLSGALTSGLGMPGPPLMVYFASTTLSPSVLRSTTLACFLVIYLASLILQIVVGSSSLDVFYAALLLTPATALGAAAGQILFTRMNTAFFMKLLYGLLLITGVYLLAEAAL